MLCGWRQKQSHLIVHSGWIKHRQMNHSIIIIFIIIIVVVVILFTVTAAEGEERAKLTRGVPLEG